MRINKTSHKSNKPATKQTRRAYNDIKTPQADKNTKLSKKYGFLKSILSFIHKIFHWIKPRHVDLKSKKTKESNESHNTTETLDFLPASDLAKLSEDIASTSAMMNTDNAMKSVVADPSTDVLPRNHKKPLHMMDAHNKKTHTLSHYAMKSTYDSHRRPGVFKNKASLKTHSLQSKSTIRRSLFGHRNNLQAKSATAYDPAMLHMKDPSQFTKFDNTDIFLYRQTPATPNVQDEMSPSLQNPTTQASTAVPTMITSSPAGSNISQSGISQSEFKHPQEEETLYIHNKQNQNHVDVTSPMDKQLSMQAIQPEPLLHQLIEETNIPTPHRTDLDDSINPELLEYPYTYDDTTNNMPEPRNIEVVGEVAEHTPIQDMDTEIESQETIPTTILDGVTSNTEPKNTQPNNSPALDASIKLEDKKEVRFNSYRNIIQEALALNKSTPNLHKAILKEIPDSFFGGYWYAMAARAAVRVIGNIYARRLWKTLEKSLHSSYPEGTMAALAAIAISIQFTTRVMLNAKNKLVWEDSPNLFDNICNSIYEFIGNKYNTACQMNVIKSALQIRTELWKFNSDDEASDDESSDDEASDNESAITNPNSSLWKNLELSYIALQTPLPEKSA